MTKMRKFRLFLFLIAVLSLGLVSPLLATTPPALSISDDAGNTITMDSTGTVTFGGNCNPGVTCATGFISVTTPGQILWSGTIGTFSVTAIVGITKPFTTGDPTQDLSLQHISTTAGGTITFQWTDTDFNYAGITGGTIQAGGTLTGSGSSTYSSYFDGTNVPFGTGTLVGTLGPLGPGSFGGTVSGPGPTAVPFSMTEVAVVTLGPNAVFGVDFAFVVLPSPLKLTCASGSAQVGVPYNSSLMATGGLTPC